MPEKHLPLPGAAYARLNDFYYGHLLIKQGGIVEHEEARKLEAFGQVSRLIASYTADGQSTGEMLPKTPMELEAVSNLGLNRIYMIDEFMPQAIAHAALWPLYEDQATGLRVLEFGSWIVDPRFRHHRINGMTLGEHIAAETVTAALADQPTVILATVKRTNSFRGLKKVGFEPVGFAKQPVLTALTCSCATSELAGNGSCPHRRAAEPYPQGDNGKIPCTLMIHRLSELKALSSFQQAAFRDFQFPDTVTPNMMRYVANKLNIT